MGMTWLARMPATCSTESKARCEERQSDRGRFGNRDEQIDAGGGGVIDEFVRETSGGGADREVGCRAGEGGCVVEEGILADAKVGAGGDVQCAAVQDEASGVGDNRQVAESGGVELIIENRIR